MVIYMPRLKTDRERTSEIHPFNMLYFFCEKES